MTENQREREAQAGHIPLTHLVFRSQYGCIRSQWSYDHVNGAVVRELSPAGVEAVAVTSRLKLLRGQILRCQSKFKSKCLLPHQLRKEWQDA